MLFSFIMSFTLNFVSVEAGDKLYIHTEVAHPSIICRIESFACAKGRNERIHHLHHLHTLTLSLE